MAPVRFRFLDPHRGFLFSALVVIFKNLFLDPLVVFRIVPGQRFLRGCLSGVPGPIHFPDGHLVQPIAVPPA